MNAFVNAVTGAAAPNALTHKGGLTHSTSGNAVVDMFQIIGSLATTKGRNDVSLSNMYETAVKADADRAIRTMLWARDIRGGAGRRAVFREWLQYLEVHDPKLCALVIPYVPVFGRWDDLLVFTNGGEMQTLAFRVIRDGFADAKTRGLVAKWMPRKAGTAGKKAQVPALRRFLGLSPKLYRNFLVQQSDTVEQKMCARTWDKIDYSKLPSVASTRYRKSFYKHDAERFNAFVEALTKAPVDSKEVKLNVGALYPFDIIHGLRSARTKSERDFAEQQWKRLENFVGEAPILPIIDVSGSMDSARVQGTIRAMDVAVSLGVYLAEKNQGPFKDIVVNFSERSEFVQLSGDLTTRCQQAMGMDWGTTNLQAAFDNILNTATANRVPQADMPQYLVVISDMEFDPSYIDGQYTRQKKAVTGLDALRHKYEAAGYQMPKVIYWNVNGRQGNSPAKAYDQNIALISGFSPAIMKAVLKQTKIDPLTVLDNAVMVDRYDIGQAELLAKREAA